MLIHQGTGRLFVAVPCYAKIPAQTAMSLRQFEQVAVLSGNCHVDDARNILIAKFLETDSEELLFIDADMAFDNLDSFLAKDVDVVGVGCPKKSDTPVYNVNLLLGPIYSEEGLIEVDGVGTGVLKIKRHVLETLTDESEKFQAEGLDCALIFERGIVDGKRQSGDLHFCKKWRDLGGKIFVDPEVRMSHVGEKVWSGTFGSHLRRVNGLSLVRGVEKIRSDYERTDVISLIEEWGNEDFSAGHEFLASCIEVAQQSEKVVEFGSGLTSICMAAFCEVHCYEHDPVWCQHLLTHKERLGLDSLHVHFSPLVNGWYFDVTEQADVVVCDGPPRYLGNRDHFWDVVDAKLILQDDVEEITERNGYTGEIMGQIRKFALWRAQTSSS